MSSLSVYHLYRILSQDSFVLIYMGEFDDELTTILMEINDVSKSEMKAQRKKISYLIAECFQNIIRHSDKKNRSDISVEIPEMFVLRDRRKIHQLITTNIVKNGFVESLKTKLNSLQNLSAEELKELYTQVFQNNERTERGGAGLGLIDMARKSGTAPTYEFVDLGNGFSNFFMQVNVLAKDFEGVVREEDTSITSALDIYNQMTAEKVVMAKKGDFSQEAVLPLIQLFENNLNLKEEQIGLAKKVLYILIEMLQNMTRYAELQNGMKEGIFYIAETDVKNYTVCTGNFLKTEQAYKLKSDLEALLKMDKIELSKAYKKKLMSDEQEEGKGAGIGLIELCRHSSDQLIYDISESGNGLSFFSLQVKV
ncbi:MAG: SiaB family protein kinase [Crocinitomicaceae bacterium]|nr:SiaB family protein kinase [Crocinitomicaceae bacterium]